MLFRYHKSVLKVNCAKYTATDILLSGFPDKRERIQGTAQCHQLISGAVTLRCQSIKFLLWGRMHWAYLEETKPLLLNHQILTGKLHNYLADLDEQAQDRYRLIIRQMAAEGVTDDLKRRSQLEWVRVMNSIVNRAEESIKRELIYT